MARDWEQFADTSETDWEQFAEEPRSWNIFGDPVAFRNQMRANPLTGGVVPGANRAFAKIFGFGPHVESTRKAAEEAALRHPGATKAGEISAGLYSTVPFFMAGTQAAQAIPGVGGMGANILGGALGGGLLGAAETPEKGESRMANIARDAALGAVLPPALKATGSVIGALSKGVAKHAKPIARTIVEPSRLSYSKIAQTAKEAVKDVVEKGSNKYSDAFKPAIEKGYGKLDKLRLNPAAVKSLKKFAKSENYEAALKRYMQEPSLDNAKKLSSDLRGYAERFKKLPPASKSSEGREIYKGAIVARKQIEDGIKKQLRKAGGDKLVNQYEKADTFWRQNVAGPKYSNLLKRFESGKLSDKDFVKDIVKTKEGRATLKGLVPDAVYRDIINKILFRGGAAYVGHRALKELSEGKNSYAENE